MLEYFSYHTPTALLHASLNQLAFGGDLLFTHNLTDLHGCAEATPLTIDGEGHLSLPAGSRS
jgi:hypothetical protein